MKNLLLLVGLFFALNLTSQTVLTGKITVAESGEELIGATVKVLKCGEIVRGVVSNFDGDYKIPLDVAGVYDLEVSYTGFETQKLAAVAVLPNRVNLKNVKMGLSKNVIYCDFHVPFYNDPTLYRKDKTSSGQTFSSAMLKWFQ